MKFLIIGLGSMGKRRIRNLKHLNENDIIGCDTSEERRNETEKKFQIHTFSNLDDAFNQNPDAVIISTPPSMHYEIAIMTAKHKKPFFMEANVLPEGFDKVIQVCKEEKIFYAPSCTMRFNPSLQKIHELIKEKKIGKTLSFIYHVGQYLPDWHPFEDYRKFYVSKKESGACREIVPFEINWLIWTFGKITKLSAMKRKVSNLEADIDDIYATLLEFENGLIGNLVVDVLSRRPYRTLRIIGETGIIEWEWITKKIKLYDSQTMNWKEFDEPEGIKIEGYVAEENQYIDEMKAFINGITNNSQYSHSMYDEEIILKILQKIEESSDSNIQILLD